MAEEQVVGKSFGESGRLPDSEDFHKVGEMTMDARHEVTAYTSRRRRKKALAQRGHGAGGGGRVLHDVCG